MRKVKPTGRAAPITAEIGATAAALPRERAEYSAEIPIAPERPASSDHRIAVIDGSCSLLTTAAAERTAIPEMAESAKTWNGLMRRVAKPPLKSPLPQNNAAANASRIPSIVPFEWKSLYNVSTESALVALIIS